MILDWFKRLFKNKQTLELNERTSGQTNEQSSLDFDKESVQLGLAAGYTGRSIHDIHAALSRIETLMPSKDWLLVQFEEQLRRHEENEQRHLEIILKALNSLHLLSSEMPEPVKTKILEEVRIVERNLGVTKRMQELIQLIKYYGEASYKNLAEKLVLTPSGFRSLLSMTMERTNEIEKIIRNNTKYLRYKGQNIDLSIQTRVQTDQNQTNEQTDKQT